MLSPERQSARMLNPAWHRMLLYSCTRMATVGVKELTEY